MVRKCIPCGTPPTPYYKGDKNSVTQDHASVYRDTAYAAGVIVPEEFVVPAIGEDVQICSKELVNIVIGSYFWNPAYGYLKVVHFDSCTGNLGLLNEDINGAAIPGTVVSAGSLFAVTARPCCADQETFSIFPFLAEDYVIPGVGNNVTLSVTSTYGLIEGTNVRIGSNVYLLDNINSSLEIVVTNTGAGGTPGDIVEARDINGDLQYLITQAVVSACISSGADLVRLLGCDGANEAILEGDFAGQVPVLQDPTTSEAAYYLLDTQVRVCTGLTSAVNILAATPSYTIDVEDESIFAIGQIIQIDSSAFYWEITDNTTPGELDITCVAVSIYGYVTVNPGSNFTYPAGVSVCLQLTQDSLNVRLANFNIAVSSGWIVLPSIPEGTYISADSFSLVGDYTLYFKAGQKIRWYDPSVKYGNVQSAVFAAGLTTITIITNLDYVVANAPIQYLSFSLGNPQDFPPYFNYDCNATGFSVIANEDAIYWVIENSVHIKAFVLGTSDAPTFTIDLPTPFLNIAPFAAASMNGYTSLITNNGSATDDIGRIYTSGITVDLFRTQTTTTWTAANDKGALVICDYLIDQ